MCNAMFTSLAVEPKLNEPLLNFNRECSGLCSMWEDISTKAVGPVARKGDVARGKLLHAVGIVVGPGPSACGYWCTASAGPLASRLNAGNNRAIKCR